MLPNQHNHQDITKKKPSKTLILHSFAHKWHRNYFSKKKKKQKQMAGKLTETIILNDTF